MKFSAGGGGSFLKINDKESVVGLFRGDPFEYKQHWINKQGVYCTGEGCPACADDEKKNAQDGGKRKATFRFRLNFVTYDGVEYKPWILEQGWNFYQDLKGLHEGDYNLEKTLVKITRMGTGNMTKYTILPVANKVMTEEELARIGQVKLLELEKKEIFSAPPPHSNTPSYAHRGSQPNGLPPYPDDMEF